MLIVLADKANDDGTGAYPSIETIRRETRLKSDSTVHEALAELEHSGQIRRCGKGPKGTTRWQIVMAEDASFFRRPGGSSPLLEEPLEASPDGGTPEIGPLPEIGPEPSLGTVQRELDLEDGSMDGSDPETGPPAVETWTRILGHLEKDLRAITFHNWIEPLELVRILDRRELVLYTPPRVAETVRNRYAAKIVRAARRELGDAAHLTLTTKAPPRRLPAGREGDKTVEAA